MQSELLPANIHNQKVLFVALDWGMGHTTRSVSIIRQLLVQGNEIVFAGNAQQLSFMESEFPVIRLAKIEGYGVELDSRRSTYLQLGWQFKKILNAINAEQKWLAAFLVNEEIDLIISDNRYGFYSDAVPSIIITHQLALQIPKFKSFVNRQVMKRVERFACCWVPDDANHRLTGELSIADPKIPVHYIGPLNRFKQLDRPMRYAYLLILSGPEPERTNFLKEGLAFLNTCKGQVAIVGEKSKKYDSYPSPTTNELEELIAVSSCVISRAGYTTIMEMVGLSKKAVLIPTKGQYEQEYLAQYIKHPLLSFSW